MKIIERTYTMDELIPQETLGQFSKKEMEKEVKIFFTTIFGIYPAYDFDGLRVFVRPELLTQMDDVAVEMINVFFENVLISESKKYFR